MAIQPASAKTDGRGGMTVVTMKKGPFLFGASDSFDISHCQLVYGTNKR